MKCRRFGCWQSFAACSGGHTCDLYLIVVILPASRASITTNNYNGHFGRHGVNTDGVHPQTAGKIES